MEHLASDTDTESESDTDSDTKVAYTKERSTKRILQDGQDPLSAPGRGLEHAWDDFGFPVLSCFEESAALVLDNRSAFIMWSPYHSHVIIFTWQG